MFARVWHFEAISQYSFHCLHACAVKLLLGMFWIEQHFSRLPPLQFQSLIFHFLDSRHSRKPVVLRLNIFDDLVCDIEILRSRIAILREIQSNQRCCLLSTNFFDLFVYLFHEFFPLLLCLQSHFFFQFHC